VFITNDGNYAVTINEWGRKQHGGWGNYVIAFYNKNGLIKNYSLEQILHYPDKISKDRFNELCPRSISGRYWLARPFFFDLSGDKLYFCVWLRYGKHWLAWDVSTGNEAEITRELQTRWNEKGRNWALKEGIRNPVVQRSTYEFLAEMKNPDDRDIFENLLKTSAYSTSGATKIESKSVMRVYDLRGSSAYRKMADDFLADLNEPLKVRKPYNRTYKYLGIIQGDLRLPKLSENVNSCLCVYLIPKDTPMENWHDSNNLVSMCKGFECPNYSLAGSEFTNYMRRATLPSCEMPFVFEDIMPGEYRLKAIWCQTDRYDDSCDCIKVQLKLSEYESSLSPVFEVKAGEKTSGINIECTHEITNESN
jgi:hypothetical protein